MISALVFWLALATSTNMYVTKPVAALQFDMTTAGTLTLFVADKTVAQAPIAGGKVRVVIYGVNQTTFSGRFATVDAPVGVITNITASGPGAVAVAGVGIVTILPPANLRRTN